MNQTQYQQFQKVARYAGQRVIGSRGSLDELARHADQLPLKMKPEQGYQAMLGSIAYSEQFGLDFSHVLANPWLPEWLNGYLHRFWRSDRKVNEESIKRNIADFYKKGVRHVLGSRRNIDISREIWGDACMYEWAIVPDVWLAVSLSIVDKENAKTLLEELAR